MVDFLADNFSGCVVLAVFLLAMLPTLESKIAIPFALSVTIWGEQTLSPILAFFVALAGSMVPAIFVMIFARWIKKKTAGFVQERFMKRYDEKLKKLQAQNSTFKKCLMLATFVAVPLPMTGVWTGSLLAGLGNIKIWQGFLSVLFGEVISCAVMLLLCLVFENSAFYIFMISLVLVAVFVVINLIISTFNKLKERRKSREIEISCL